MSKRKHQKAVKLKRVLYLLGYRDYLDARSGGRRLFAVLSRKEQKAYRKGQKAAMRVVRKFSLIKRRKAIEPLIFIGQGNGKGPVHKA